MVVPICLKDLGGKAKMRWASAPHLHGDSSGGARDEGRSGLLLGQNPSRPPPSLGQNLVPDAPPGLQVAFLEGLEGVGDVNDIAPFAPPGSQAMAGEPPVR